MQKIKHIRADKPALFCGILAISSVILIILSIYPIAMIVIGSKYQNLCPIEKYIPIWLIVDGSVSLVFSFFTVLIFITTSRDWKVLTGLLTFINAIVSIFLFAWFIAGNVWVYSNYSKVQYSDDLASSTYCDKTVYLFSFWTITVSYIMLGLMCIIGLVIGCCFCFCGLAMAGFAK